MAKRLHQTTISMEYQQYQAIIEIARREGRSISMVARRVIAAGLASYKIPEDLWIQREQALAGLRKIRENQKEYPGDLIEDLRSERDQENETLWQS